mmetsp:Transcript_22773/g.59438  ORF Transcript_22773/g.59438 Transcript_22773/m.59438 type:complete len:261 (+) Transcript_22773:770-1552(+)
MEEPPLRPGGRLVAPRPAPARRRHAERRAGSAGAPRRVPRLRAAVLRSEAGGRPPRLRARRPPGRARGGYRPRHHRVVGAVRQQESHGRLGQGRRRGPRRRRQRRRPRAVCGAALRPRRRGADRPVVGRPGVRGARAAVVVQRARQRGVGRVLGVRLQGGRQRAARSAAAAGAAGAAAQAERGHARGGLQGPQHGRAADAVCGSVRLPEHSECDPPCPAGQRGARQPVRALRRDHGLPGRVPQRGRPSAAAEGQRAQEPD